MKIDFDQKEIKDHILSVRITDTTKKQLNEICKQSDCSKANLIEYLINYCHKNVVVKND